MATWSIIGDGARIDPNTGKITFDENTTSSDRNFTVTYEDNYGNTASTVITQMRRNGVDPAGVDLGLPSGNIWATENLGGTNAYYQYGKTSQFPITSGGSIYSGTENPLAATADTYSGGWGGPWHLPTKEDYQELFNTSYTTHEWFYNSASSVWGLLFTSVTDTTKKVFFPACGALAEDSGTKINNDYCMYLTSSPCDSDSTKATIFIGTSRELSTDDLTRGHGYSARGIYKDYSRQKYD